MRKTYIMPNAKNFALDICYEAPVPVAVAEKDE